jgi:hypothetical protein
MRRSNRGSGLVEGVVGLHMVIGGTVLATLLILNSGTSILSKNKILLVTGQAAQYAAAHQSDADLQSETQAFVQSLMPVVGLTPNRLSVTVTATAVNGVQGQQVCVTNQFPLFGTAGGAFPTQIQLADTEFAGSSIVGSNP